MSTKIECRSQLFALIGDNNCFVFSAFSPETQFSGLGVWSVSCLVNASTHLGGLEACLEVCEGLLLGHDIYTLRGTRPHITPGLIWRLPPA